MHVATVIKEEGMNWEGGNMAGDRGVRQMQYSCMKSSAIIKIRH